MCHYFSSDFCLLFTLFSRQKKKKAMVTRCTWDLRVLQATAVLSKALLSQHSHRAHVTNVDPLSRWEREREVWRESQRQNNKAVCYHVMSLSPSVPLRSIFLFYLYVYAQVSLVIRVRELNQDEAHSNLHCRSAVPRSAYISSVGCLELVLGDYRLPYIFFLLETRVAKSDPCVIFHYSLHTAKDNLGRM